MHATGKSRPRERAAWRESRGEIRPSRLWSKKERWRWKACWSRRVIGIFGGARCVVSGNGMLCCEEWMMNAKDVTTGRKRSTKCETSMTFQIWSIIQFVITLFCPISSSINGRTHNRRVWIAFELVFLYSHSHVTWSTSLYYVVVDMSTNLARSSSDISAWSIMSTAGEKERSIADFVIKIIPTLLYT